MKKKHRLILLIIALFFLQQPAEAFTWDFFRESSTNKIYVDIDSIHGGGGGHQAIKYAWFKYVPNASVCDLPDKISIKNDKEFANKCYSSVAVYEAYYKDEAEIKSYSVLAYIFTWTDGTEWQENVKDPDTYMIDPRSSKELQWDLLYYKYGTKY